MKKRRYKEKKKKKRDRQKGWPVRSLFIPLSTAGPRMADYPVNAAVPNLYPAPSFDLSALIKYSIAVIALLLLARFISDGNSSYSCAPLVKKKKKVHVFLTHPSIACPPPPCLLLSSFIHFILAPSFCCPFLLDVQINHTRKNRELKEERRQEKKT